MRLPREIIKQGYFLRYCFTDIDICGARHSINSPGLPKRQLMQTGQLLITLFVAQPPSAVIPPRHLLTAGLGRLPFCIIVGSVGLRAFAYLVGAGDDCRFGRGGFDDLV